MYNCTNIKSICLTTFSMLTLACTVSITPVMAQQIITDGYTNTTLNVNGNVTTVTTQTVKGNNAFNSFSKFNVYEGNTVNMIVPAQVENLINIIKNETTSIEGTLNALRNSEVAGNLFLVNPYGVIVGATGVINAGSLTNVTPTKEFVDNFFDSPGNPNSAHIDAVLNGTAPINPNVAVVIDGKINALTSDVIQNGSQVNMSDIVNLGEMDDSTPIIIAGNINKEAGSIMPDETTTAVKVEDNKIYFGKPANLVNPEETPVIEYSPEDQRPTYSFESTSNITFENALNTEERGIVTTGPIKPADVTIKKGYMGEERGIVTTGPVKPADITIKKGYR